MVGRGLWHRSLQLSVGLMVRLLLLLLRWLRPWMVNHCLNRNALRLVNSLLVVVSLWRHVIITASMCGWRWRQRGCRLNHVRGHGVVLAVSDLRSTIDRGRNRHRVGIN